MARANTELRPAKFQSWYTQFRERQKLRYDWIPLGDICKRLVETKGISTEEARREIVKLLRDGWFNRKVGRSGAWLIYPPDVEIGRVGSRVVSDAEVHKSPDIASVWLNVVEQGGAINGELFESCWLPRDLVIRWCDNYSVPARPDWREAPTPLEFPASIFEGQWNHDIVRLRWLWFHQIGKRCGNPECKALPCTPPKAKLKRGPKEEWPWDDMKAEAFRLMGMRGGPPKRGGEADWETIADFERSISGWCIDREDGAPSHGSLHKKITAWIDEWSSTNPPS